MRSIRYSAAAALGVSFAASALVPTHAYATGLPGPASPTAAKPTIVLVHGAWADTSSWNGEVEILRNEGYQVRAVANPLQDLTTDSQTVADFLKTVQGPVVLVGHSYGGSVITNAAAETENVKALVYVDAAAPAVGETNGSLSGSDSALNAPASRLFDTAAYAQAPSDGKNLYLKKDIFLKDFASDLPAKQAEGLWATQRAASTVAFNTPSQHAAWKTIPSWYFISSGDRIITPQSEERMARRARSKTTVFRGGSHLTLISHPDAVAKVISTAARSVGG
ncbi:alpha/beta hydrolase [Streptomyces spiralis]